MVGFAWYGFYWSDYTGDGRFSSTEKTATACQLTYRPIPAAGIRIIAQPTRSSRAFVRKTKSDWHFHKIALRTILVTQSNSVGDSAEKGAYIDIRLFGCLSERLLFRVIMSAPKPDHLGTRLFRSNPYPFLFMDNLVGIIANLFKENESILSNVFTKSRSSSAWAVITARLPEDAAFNNWSLSPWGDFNSIADGFQLFLQIISPPPLRSQVHADHLCQIVECHLIIFLSYSFHVTFIIIRFPHRPLCWRKKKKPFIEEACGE